METSSELALEVPIVSARYARRFVRFMEHRGVKRHTILANTGITALVDPLGRILGQVVPDQMGLLDGALPERLETTPFARWQHWPFFIALAISAALVLIGKRISGRRRS